MKTRFLPGFATVALICGMVCTAATPAAVVAKAVKSQTATPATIVRVESAWVRAAPPGAMMLAGYMTLHNDGKAPLQFEWAQSDLFGMVELHKTLLVNGISTMRPSGAQTIAAGGTLRFEPGGLHLMLMQPQRELKIGDSVRFRLHFTDGSVQDVVAKVSAEAPAAASH